MCVWISKYYFIFSFLHDAHIGVSMYIFVFLVFFLLNLRKVLKQFSPYIYNKVDSTHIYIIQFIYTYLFVHCTKNGCYSVPSQLKKIHIKTWTKAVKKVGISHHIIRGIVSFFSLQKLCSWIIKLWKSVFQAKNQPVHNGQFELWEEGFYLWKVGRCGSERRLPLSATDL